MYKIKEIHINVNVIKCGIEKGSLYKNIPINNMIVGAIYCRNPDMDNGISCTALPNNSKGIAVATPADINNKLILKEP